jgi:hypothetical protein
MSLDRAVSEIPLSLRDVLSKRLVEIILGTSERDAVPVELAKRIIYLWRQDQLESEAGIRTLLQAAMMVDSEAIRFRC